MGRGALGRGVAGGELPRSEGAQLGAGAEDGGETAPGAPGREAGAAGGRVWLWVAVTPGTRPAAWLQELRSLPLGARAGGGGRRAMLLSELMSLPPALKAIKILLKSKP